MTEQEKLDYINTTCNTTYKSMEVVQWKYISHYRKLSEDFIRKFKDDVDWYRISRYQKLSEDFIREFKDYVNWGWILECQQLSEDFIRDFADKVNWETISIYHKLSEDFIREFKDKLDWRYISRSQKLSENFIREFADEVYWWNISIYQKLSENFIREFKDYVNWGWISECQQLSEDFICEFSDKVNWIFISKHQKLSEDFIKEYKYRLYIYKIEDNWKYKDTEFLKQQVIDTGLYECHEDYFIAYKGIRSDRYSNFNFQYQYLPGETYESWCDYSSDENSFGLSVWTEEKAREYCNQLVVKVKVNYEDVGRVVHNGGKIRCKKITILN